MNMHNYARQKRRFSRGYTMAECMVAMTVTSFIFTGLFSILSTTAICFDDTNKEVTTDSDAVLAMQMIVQDVREAKTITLLNYNTQLRVTTPKIVTNPNDPDDTYYNRYEPNLTNQTDFYLSDSTGFQGRTGTYLWRSTTDGTKRLLRKDVKTLNFVQDTTRSVEITVITQNSAAGSLQQASLTQRVVYLRNY